MQRTKKSAKEQGKEDRIGDTRLQCAPWTTQGRIPKTIYRASIGVEDASTSIWAAVAASPMSAPARNPRKQASPVKRVFACQSVSQYLGCLVIHPQPKTIKAEQRRLVKRERPSVEGSTEPWSQPRQREDVFEILRRARTPPPSPSLDEEIANTGRPETVGRGQKLQTLPSNISNKNEGQYEEYLE